MTPHPSPAALPRALALLFTTSLLPLPSLAAERPPEPAEADLASRLAALVNRPGGLTAEEAARRAAATSFDVQARREDVEAALASLQQAATALAPRLSGTARYQRLSDLKLDPLGTVAAPADQKASGVLAPGSTLVAFPIAFTSPSDASFLGAQLVLPISDYAFRLGQSYQAASHSRDAARLQAQAAELKAATDARVLYYTWARARLQMVVAEQSVEQARGHLRDVRTQFDAGAVSKADVLRVESQLAQSELLLERARSAAGVTEEALRVALHDEQQGPLAIGEDLSARVDGGAQAEELAGLIREALAARPELRSLGENRAAAAKQAQAARAGYYPVVSGVGDLIYANPNQRVIPPVQRWDFTWDVGIQATWSPNDVALSHAGARNADARARGIELQRRALEDAVRNEVTQARASLREALVSIDTSARGLAAAEEAYRVRRALFQNGRATSVELTDTETDLTRARLEAVSAQLDARVASARLTHALGRDVPRG